MKIWLLLWMWPSSALVNMYGDSILAKDAPIQHDLQSFAPDATIQNFAKVGAGMRDGWVQSIPSIYHENKAPIPVTVILDGGGNDINAIRQECVNMSIKCRETILDVVQVTTELMDAMIEDGVQHVIYLGLFYVDNLEKAVDFGNDRIKKYCHTIPQCHFVDLRCLSVQLGWDGMHPTRSSYHDISATIWDIVQQHRVPFTRPVR